MANDDSPKTRVDFLNAIARKLNEQLDMPLFKECPPDTRRSGGAEELQCKFRSALIMTVLHFSPGRPFDVRIPSEIHPSSVADKILSLVVDSFGELRDDKSFIFHLKECDQHRKLFVEVWNAFVGYTQITCRVIRPVACP